MSRSALAVVAHADDESLGCGGTLARLADEGWSVDVAILSNGILTTRGEVQDNRADARAACRVLGVPDERVHFLGFDDQKFDCFPVADLANAVAALGLEPDLILTHVQSDLNRDHRLTCEAAKIVGRPRRKPISILGCEIPATTFWNGRAFAANYFVDVSATLERKIEAFACYGNELRAFPDPWSREGIELLARYHGMLCGLPAAEAFTVIRGYGASLP